MPQKWSKGKMKEKVNNLVLFDKVRLAASGRLAGCALSGGQVPA